MNPGAGQCPLPRREKGVAGRCHHIAGSDGRVTAAHYVEVTVEGPVADMSGIAEPRRETEARTEGIER